MVRASGNDELPLGVIVDEDGKPADDRDLDYVSSGSEQIELHDSEKASIALDAQAADGTKIEKTFSLRR